MNKRVVLFVLVSLMSLASYSQKMKVTIYNKTGFDIDSVRFQGKQIGLIKKNGFAVITDLEKLTLEGYQYENELPQFDVDAIINHKKKDKEPFARCGTGVTFSTKTEGKFEFDIIFYEGENGYVLAWGKHEKAK
jgi:hypothetical protein